MIIQSTHNKIIKQLSALKQKKERDKSNLFVLEGERLINEIPSDWDISYFAVSEGYVKNKDISSLREKSKVFVIDNNIFEKISDTVNTQGIIAVCVQKKYDINNILKKENPFIVILEKVCDPGNLGTIIRTSDAAAADCVVLSKGCVDLYNPKVIRSTMGSVFHLPVITAADLNYVITKLKACDIKVFAAHLKADKILYEADFKSGLAVLIGNEANGLTNEISDFSDMLVKIPMPGKAESINASIASAIIIYEVLRQRTI